MTDSGGFGIDEVMRRLPHRYPFLLVDRVLECVAAERITAIKNVTANEEFFSGHFPGRPVMPAALGALNMSTRSCKVRLAPSRILRAIDRSSTLEKQPKR